MAATIFILVGIATAVQAIQPDDWQQKLPPRLREALAQLDPARYEVVPRPRRMDASVAAARRSATAFDRLQGRYPGRRRIDIDARTGAPLIVEGAGIPVVPGAGNRLTAPAFGPAPRGGRMEVADLAAVARAFARQNEALLGLDPDDTELDRGAVARTKGDRYWALQLHQVVRSAAFGIVPVRDAHLFFRVNNGNLIQFGNYLAAPPQGISFSGVISRQQAVERVRELTGGASVTITDAVLDLGQTDRSLQIVLVNGPGESLRHQLVRSLFAGGRDFAVELWLDAHTGELVNVLNARDSIDGLVTGGIYPNTNTDPEQSRPMPFLNVTNGGVQTTNAAGIYNYTSGTLATASLDGQYVTISDDCGAATLSTSVSPGNLSFGGGGAGTDCTTPGTGGPGNTHASRSAFYHLNEIKEKGRQYVAAAPWLTADLTVYVNLSGECNAFWDPPTGTLRFYRVFDGTLYDCSNTGEIAAVFLHEYGHGLDANTSGGSSPDGASREAFADVTAFLQTHGSCIGPNFTPGRACRHGCTAACTGVRDVNLAPNATPANIESGTVDCTTTVTTPNGTSSTLMCSTGGGGVLGYQVHCESHIASGAMWDLATALVGRYGEGAGWAAADRLWYTAVSSVGAAYQITAGSKCMSPTVDGCGSGNWYTVILGIDDDNGTLADGTPNADLIWNAFNDHGIACGASQPPVSSSCTLPPAPATFTATAAAGQVNLSWSAVAGATSYTVYRNSLGCDVGFTPIADVAAPTVSYTDNAVANGTTYSYAVQAVVTPGTCVSAFTACQSATPAAPLTPANIFMVLDGSGSMSGPTSVAGESKIDALEDAGLMVADLIEDYAGDGFRLGAVSFSTAVTGTEPLRDLSVAAERTLLRNFIIDLEPTNLTAIGQGINAALAELPAANDKVVMLLSDGIQNVPPNLGLQSPPPGAAIGGTALPSDVRFYTVALGTSIQEDLFDDLANNGGIPGFYYSGGTADIQCNFEFWTASVLGLAPANPCVPGPGFTGDDGLAPAAVASNETSFQVNATARRITFLVTWAAKGTDLRFVLDTPAGPIQPPASSFHPNEGYASHTVRLPLRDRPPAAHVGVWTLRVTNPNGGPPQVPHHAQALFDDPALRLDYVMGGADPGAGEPLPLEARVFENGLPLSGLTVRATLDGPGVGVGEALSASTARPKQQGGDPGSAASQKLGALLEQSPGLLGHLTNAVTLTEASPGIYRASIPATQTSAAGTYVVNFEVLGNGVANGAIQRGQRFSRYLRLKPQQQNTLVATRFARVNDLTTIHLTFTPRDRNNQRLGPGWADYVRVTASTGSVAAIADNLDGSYSTTIEAAPGTDPVVQIDVRGETVAVGPASALSPAAAGLGGGIAAGPFIGYTFFDGSLPASDGPVVGARWSIGWTPGLRFETEVGGTSTESPSGDKGLALQLLQQFTWTPRPRPHSVRPFLRGGLGALFDGIAAQNDAAAVLALGAGIEFTLTPRFDLRIDAVDLIADDLYGAGRTHNLQVTFGISAHVP